MKILLNHSSIHKLAKVFPNVGVLFSPSRQRFYKGKYPYAIDNGAYGGKFDPDQFLKTLQKAALLPPPLFVVAPDVVADHSLTIRLWHQWQPQLAKFDFPLAFVAQDGCGAGDIPSNADWVFIGGSTEYKEWAIANLKTGKPTHCGRVNNESRLWQCFNHGIDSVDGSGWFKAPGRKRIQDLLDFLKMSNGLVRQPRNSLFDYTPYFSLPIPSPAIKR